MTERAGIVRDGEGQPLLTGPLGAILLAGAEVSDGQASFVVHPLAARALGSPVHTHRNEDEWSFVLDGEVGVQLGDETLTARRGDFVKKPRGIPHAFWNATDEPASLLEVITPAGFEGYFRRLGDILSASGPPDMEALIAIADDYDLEVDLASIPRLAEVHGLRVGEGRRGRGTR